jgi:gluconate 2-dehydrogenase gamma chain
MAITRRQAAASAALFVLPAEGRTVFSAEEAAMITQLADILVPPDETPGAGEAGAVRYLERQLQGPLKRFEKAWHEGLAALRARGFAGMSVEARTALVEEMGAGRIPELRAFFEMALDQVMQSYFGDPKHGGNAGETSWKLLGIESVMRAGPHGGHK